MLCVSGFLLYSRWVPLYLANLHKELINNGSRLVSAPGANYYSGCQTAKHVTFTWK